MWPKPSYFQNAGEGDGGGGGGGGDPWYSGFVEEGTELPAMVTESQSFESFVKQAQDYQAMQGSSIRIPGENATDEDRKAFYEKLQTQVPGLIPIPEDGDADAAALFHQRLGVPEDGAGYELIVPEGQQADEALEKWFRDVAHELKVPKSQAAGLFEKWGARQAEVAAQAQAQLKAQEVALREKWGATYEPNMKKIDMLWGNYPQFAELRENAKKGLVPGHVLEGFAAIAEGMLGKGHQMLDQDDQHPGAITPAEAKAQAEETLAKLTKLEPNDPQRPALMERLLELNKQAMPNADHSPPARAGFSS